MPGAHPSVLDYYAAHFRPGMVDLSVSSPPPAEILLPPPTSDLGYSSPTQFAALRAAIAARYPGLGPEHILVTTGASEALTALGHVLAGPGEHVQLAAGAYPSFGAAIGRRGAKAFAFRGDPGDASVVFVTNPSVPDGFVSDLAPLAVRCTAAGTRLIADEVYASLTLSTQPPTPAACLPGGHVSVGDLSKPLGLGGLRIGWLATRDLDLIARLDTELQHLSGGPSALSAQAALQAMAGFEVATASARAAALANAPAIYRTLDAHGWTFRPAEAGLTIAARPRRPLSPGDFAAQRDAGLFLLPGACLDQPGCVRIGLLASHRDLERAISVADGAPPAASECLVLSKLPGPGAKTRLAAELGEAAATSLATAMLRDTLALASAATDAVRFVFAPAASANEAADIAPGIETAPQVDGDLGDRILAALGGSLVAGRRAVLIGSDTPDLPPAIIRDAFARLDTADVVLGPAADGGFYLIGLRQADPRLFEGVEWSTPTVLQRVCSNVARLGYREAVLPAWSDVDDVPSLRDLVRRIDGSHRAPHTTAALAELPGFSDGA